MIKRFLILLLLPLMALAQTTPTTQFKTVADMAATPIPVNTNRLTALVSGRLAENDGNGGMFFYQGASVKATNRGTVFGRWVRQYSGAINIGWFGAGGGTDDTANFRDAFALLASQGGGTLILGNHVTYNVSSAANSYPFYDFTNCVGITIEGNGSTLNTGTSANYGTFLQFTSCSNVTVRDISFESGHTVLDNASGPEWLVFRQGTVNVSMRGLSFRYGAIGFTCRGSIYTDGGSDTNRTRNIVALGLSFFGTYYPLDFQGAGDNFFGRGIKTVNSGRAYFPSNVRNHDLVLDGAQGGPFSDVLLKAYASTNVYSALENIKLVYNTNGRYAGSGNEAANDTLVQLEAQILNNSDLTNGSYAGFTNIDVTINYHGSGSDRDQGIFSIKKFLPDGTPDTAARGHSIDGLYVRGAWSGLSHLLAYPFNLFGWGSDSWAGDHAKNIYLSPQLSGDYNLGSVLDGSPFTITNAPGAIVENTTGGGYFALINFTNANTYALLKNVHFTNINTDLDALTYLNGSASTGAVVNIQLTGGQLNIGGPTTISNTLQIHGHTQILNHQLIISDNDAPNTGANFDFRFDGPPATKAIFDVNKFDGVFLPMSIQAGGSERILISTAGVVSLFGDEVVNAGRLIVSSSATPETGGTLLIKHDGNNAIIESSFYTGAYKNILWRTGGTNQMVLGTDGTLYLTNTIRIATTGGAGQYLKQTTLGGPITSSVISAGDLPDSGVTSGTYGNASYIPQITLNSKGVVTGITTNLIANTGETNTASNLGTGSGIFNSKSGVDLRFNSLAAGRNVTISSNANVLTIAYAPVTNFTTIACSDTTSPLTTGTGKQYWRAKRAFTLKDVRASVSTASSSGIPTINIKKNGVTIFSTELTIDAGEKTSVTAATPYVFSTTAIADDDELTFDIDGAGTGTVGLQCGLYYTIP